jgi:hypothetical protein
VLQVGRDGVIARLKDALDRDIQRVGAVQRENPALRTLAVEEAIQGQPRVVDRALGLLGHAMAGPPRVGQLRPGEAVQRLVDRLGFGKLVAALSR